MMLVRLMGGLGNQMFQYAVGRRLALERGVPLKLDLSWFLLQSSRQYMLDRFKINAEIATSQEVASLTRSDRRGLPARLYRLVGQKYAPYYRRSVVQERNHSFDPLILNVKSNVLLIGYWQSEKYFKPVAGLLRQELRPKDTWNKENSLLVRQIQDCQGVSIHVRRGDYVADPITNNRHGVLLPSYYEEAARVIKSKITNPHFFVFSDDISWTQEHLDFHAPTYYISHNKNEDYWDMILMSYCSHYVIANSSFSWWGAWLNPDSEKYVIAPRHWYKTGMVNPDLLPEDWIKI